MRREHRECITLLLESTELFCFYATWKQNEPDVFISQWSEKCSCSQELILY